MQFQEVQERIEQIVSKPLIEPNPEKLNQVYEEFTKRTPTSAKLFSRAKKIIPQGTQHTHPLIYPYPVFIDHGKGSKIIDVDGNEYIDYMLGGGTLMLGHNYEGVNDKVIDLIKNKTHYHGCSDEYEILAAEKIVEQFPSVEKVRFTSSGTEAIMAATRIVRSYTGKKKIIKFRSAYHGWGDQFLVDMEVPGCNKFLAHGIPDEFLEQTILVYPNDLDSLEQSFKTHKDEIAAVICEPFGGESGLVPFEENFIKNVIQITHKHKALFIFDEVVSGFCLGIGGAQKFFEIDPDLTIFGKGLMNGYPSCGAVGGKEEVMQIASNQLPTGGSPFAYVAGTLSATVLSVASCYFSLCELEKPGLIESAVKTTEDLCSEINKMFASYNSDFFTHSFGTIIRTELTSPHGISLKNERDLIKIIERRKTLSIYSLVVQNEGIMSRMGRDILCCSHKKEDTKKYIKAYEKLLYVLKN